jgi:hypothetical protein
MTPLVSLEEIHNVLGDMESPSYENGQLESYEEWLTSQGALGDQIADIEFPDPLTTVIATEAALGYPIAVGPDDGSLQDGA